MGLEYLTNVMKRRCTAFVLSDFIDQESFKNAMTIANRKHDLVAVQVYDRRVEELPPVGLMKIGMPRRDMSSGLTPPRVPCAVPIMIGG